MNNIESLPEKWFIYFNNEDQAKVLIDYFSTKDPSYRNYTFTGPDRTFNSFNEYCGSTYGYTEVTFEQFKKYVLKEKAICLPERWSYKCESKEDFDLLSSKLTSLGINQVSHCGSTYWTDYWKYIRGCGENSNISGNTHFCTDNNYQGLPNIDLKQILTNKNQMNKVTKVRLKKDLPGIKAGFEIEIGNQDVKTIKYGSQEFLWTDTNFWEHCTECTFKPGDWITSTDGDIGIRRIKTIIDPDKNGNLVWTQDKGAYSTNGESHFYSKGSLRLATPAEIKKYLDSEVLVKIGSYTADFKVRGSVVFGCKTFTKAEVQAVLRFKSVLQGQGISDTLTLMQLETIISNIK